MTHTMQYGHWTDDKVLTLFRKLSIRKTAQRIILAKLLLSKPQHVYAEEVLDWVRSSDEPVSRATVYNNLRLFADKGLLREVNIDARRTFYDTNVRPHHHFYNEDTKELTDFPPEGVSLEGLPPLPPDTQQVGEEIIIRLRKKH